MTKTPLACMINQPIYEIYESHMTIHPRTLEKKLTFAELTQKEIKPIRFFLIFEK